MTKYKKTPLPTLQLSKAEREENAELMENHEKIILDLCGGTGSWSRPYKQAGYDVRLITLPDYDVRTYTPPDHVYGILAAPPCTEFSVAKGSRPRDFAEGMSVVEACMRIIWMCKLTGSIKFWALENPVGFLRLFLGVPAYQFEHWESGDPQIKRTNLWGYFHPPVKSVRVKPENLTLQHGTRANGRGWAKPECPPEYAHLGLDRAALRAITPPGFAQAFYAANK